MIQKALMSFQRPHINSFSENDISAFQTCVFGHRSDIYEMDKISIFLIEYLERTRRPGEIFFPYSAQNQPWFAHKSLI
jgi:hypothetical protein